MKREHGEEEVKGVEQGADAGEGGGGGDLVGTAKKKGRKCGNEDDD